MIIDLKVPASGESVTSANVARWQAKSGDSVRAGQVLVTIETDKVSNELEAPADGVLEIVVHENEEVAIGTVIARIQANDGAVVTEAPVLPAANKAESKSVSGAAGQAVEIRVPASGESVTSANVASWRRQDGDLVAAGEILVVLETDKVSNELESPADGVLRIMVPEGEEVPIGSLIARVEPGGSSPFKRTQESAPEPVIASAQSAVSSAPVQLKPVKEQEPTAPVSGPDFSAKPVREQETEARVDGRSTRRKMSMMRRKIATHLVNAQQTAAILTTFNEVDMSAVMSVRKQVQEEFLKKHGVKLGFMSFFIKAVVQALKDVPSINGRIEGNDIIENHYFDISVAIGTDKGLFVPVIRDCDRKSFAQIEQDIVNYASRAKDGQLTLADMDGGVFSISNGGTYGSLLSTPILNPPQSGILGMHTIQQRPVAVDGQVVIRPMMYLALSYDHRLVDGKEAVTFLIRIKESLENPTRLMLEM